MKQLESKYNDEELYARAQKRIDEMKGFYWNLFTYIFVIPLLAIVNFLTTSFPWVIFPALGWGLGVVIHWFVVFKRGSFFSRQWEEQKIQEFMEEEETRQKQLYQ